ncbi:MAG: hypothetical protein JW697_03525 [Kosmotogaceae bacterium]|nr:hypothetical protein [Kosmotogaceae bacterium]
MGKLKLEEDWLQETLPEGMLYPSSTVISGPGGSGKPLIEYAFVASWLKAGGSVISIPLQYPTMEMGKTALKDLYKVDLNNYGSRVFYIQFEPNIDKYEQIGKNTVKANLLKPEVWKSAVDSASDMVETSELGTLVFGSALNLLLFSPTYKEGMLDYLREVIESDKSKSYMFSVSTSAFADEIKQWEEAAENLMFTRMEDDMSLFFSIYRMKEVSFSREEVKVPISEEQLSKIKEIAHATRSKVIPQLSRI